VAKKHLHVSGIPWPEQSLSFTVLGLFLWEAWKIYIYRNSTHTTQELECAIQDESRAVALSF